MKKIRSSSTFPAAALIAATGLCLLGGANAWAQASQTVSPTQRATASAVAEKGVPLSELAPDAPDSYTVKTGDTLWGISGLFLKSPWRWPELWGMNLNDIKNPHRIYPGQQLVLDKSGGRAQLKIKTSEVSDGSDVPLVKVSPKTRYSNLEDLAIPALQTRLIEPFLAEPLIVDQAAFEQAPRIVSAQEGRVLLSKGDRGYAKSVYANKTDDLKLVFKKGVSRNWRIYRNPTALKDPATGDVLGYEAQYIGLAELARSESVVATDPPQVLPATIDIVGSKEEIRAGDRLISESERAFVSYVPQAPTSPVQAQIVSVYGSAVAMASPNQVVVLNKGSKDGLVAGHVLAIQKNSVSMTDKTDPALPTITLPIERNGLLMVFLTFDRLSYALVLGIVDGVQVGDRVTNPR